jgi:DNA gyrase subunit A
VTVIAIVSTCPGARGGVGIITQKTTDKVGNVVGCGLVRNNQEVILTTDKGQVIRMRISDISTLGRNTQGVRLINLAEKDELVTGLAIVEADEEVVPPANNGAGVTH